MAFESPVARSGNPLERWKCAHVEVKGFRDGGTQSRGLSCVRGGGEHLDRVLAKTDNRHGWPVPS